MVQPAAGYRPITPSNDPPLDDVGGPPTDSAPPTTAGRPATDLAATQAVLEPRRAADFAIQRQLDAFREAMTPSYRTSAGYVSVSAAFTMSRPSSSERPPELRTLTSRAWADLQSAAASARLQAALGQIRSGRGTPEQIRAIAQALIDQGHAVAGEHGDPYSSVRQTMANHGIGIDCAGYVQQAYLSATGLDRMRARFGASENENLSHLERRGYERIDQLADVRPGDLVVLGAPPAIPDDPHPVGHRAIVYDQRLATPADIERLIRTPGAQPFVAGGPIRVFEVDSSWGDGGDPEVGGVQRETWWYSESAREWAWQAQCDGGRFCVGLTPYGHPCKPPAEGFFRDPRRAP